MAFLKGVLNSQRPATLLWLVFCLALILRFAYVLAHYAAMGPAGLLTEDSSLYFVLADNFVTYLDFVKIDADGLPQPETERMPLYALWLAVHQAISGLSEPLFPVLTQSVLDSTTCVFIALLGRHLDPRMMLPAGLFAACNPTQIIVSATVLSDTLFLFACTLSLLGCALWLRRPQWHWAVFIGLAVGAGIATRAMLLPWLLALIAGLPIALILLRRFKLVATGQVALLVAVALAIQSPIFARNWSQYQTLQLTSQGGPHALLWLAPLVRETMDGTSHAEGARQLNATYLDSVGGAYPANPYEQSDDMGALAWSTIAGYGVGPIAKTWLIGAAINLFSPAHLQSPSVRQLPRTGFFDVPGDSKVDKIWRFLFHNDNPLYAWLLVPGVLVLAGLRAFQLVGIGMLISGGFFAGAEARRFARLIFLMLAVWVLYVLVINGPVASPKYRLPIEPASALLFALSFAGAHAWWRRKRHPR